MEAIIRYVGVYANRLRKVYREARARLAGETQPAHVPQDDVVGFDTPPARAPPAAGGPRLAGA